MKFKLKTILGLVGLMSLALVSCSKHNERTIRSQAPANSRTWLAYLSMERGSTLGQTLQDRGLYTPDNCVQLVQDNATGEQLVELVSGACPNNGLAQGSVIQLKTKNAFPGTSTPDQFVYLLDPQSGEQVGAMEKLSNANYDFRVNDLCTGGFSADYRRESGTPINGSTGYGGCTLNIENSQFHSIDLFYF